MRELIPAAAIEARIARMAADLAAELRPLEAEGLLFVPVMDGAIHFASDLMRRLDLRMVVASVRASSYPGAARESSGRVALHGVDPAQAKGRHVVLVDDILDTGLTLGALAEAFRPHARSLRTCVLLRKERPAAHAFPVSAVGFDIPDAFVVGYGLDHDGWHRNLPGIWEL